jgi:polyphosphate glucokinase
MRTLSIDIGGTGIKAMILDEIGKPATDRAHKPTPQPGVPDAVLEVIDELAKGLGEFDRLSVGFPGVVREGVTKIAPHLDPSWSGFPLTQKLEERFGKPARVMNDAAIQGLGVIQGKGLEAVITLGTGLGCCIYVDGKPWQLELGHHPYKKGRPYEAFLSDEARKACGNKKWRKRVLRAVTVIEALLHYDVLYVGGGNARLLKPEEMPPNVRLVDNTAGILGGFRLWQ